MTPLPPLLIERVPFGRAPAPPPSNRERLALFRYRWTLAGLPVQAAPFPFNAPKDMPRHEIS